MTFSEKDVKAMIAARDALVEREGPDGSKTHRLAIIIQRIEIARARAELRLREQELQQGFKQLKQLEENE